ncbi:hypothetical protein O181_060632 [Austropuccinia psidii MF-1]|uniref:Uncharacterized protein n=1 Tax=Austropuccinia psidii MF-1 TaxID=1389203 RepID=A0A9Q3HYL7_9BASI|nr:hypothetical protein [Austropuccinia psidii MF-1]
MIIPLVGIDTIKTLSNNFLDQLPLLPPSFHFKLSHTVHQTQWYKQASELITEGSLHSCTDSLKQTVSSKANLGHSLAEKVATFSQFKKPSFHSLQARLPSSQPNTHYFQSISLSTAPQSHQGFSPQIIDLASLHAPTPSSGLPYSPNLNSFSVSHPLSRPLSDHHSGILNNAFHTKRAEASPKRSLDSSSDVSPQLGANWPRLSKKVARSYTVSDINSQAIISALIGLSTIMIMGSFVIYQNFYKKRKLNRSLDIQRKVSALNLTQPNMTQSLPELNTQHFQPSLPPAALTTSYFPTFETVQQRNSKMASSNPHHTFNKENIRQDWHHFHRQLSNELVKNSSRLGCVESEKTVLQNSCYYQPEASASRISQSAPTPRDPDYVIVNQASRIRSFVGILGFDYAQTTAEPSVMFAPQSARRLSSHRFSFKPRKSSLSIDSDGSSKPLPIRRKKSAYGMGDDSEPEEDEYCESLQQTFKQAINDVEFFEPYPLYAQAHQVLPPNTHDPTGEFWRRSSFDQTAKNIMHPIEASHILKAKSSEFDFSNFSRKQQASTENQSLDPTKRLSFIFGQGAHLPQNDIFPSQVPRVPPFAFRKSHRYSSSTPNARNSAHFSKSRKLSLEEWKAWNPELQMNAIEAAFQASNPVPCLAQIMGPEQTHLVRPLASEKLDGRPIETKPIVLRQKPKTRSSSVTLASSSFYPEQDPWRSENVTQTPWDNLLSNNGSQIILHRTSSLGPRSDDLHHKSYLSKSLPRSSRLNKSEEARLLTQPTWIRSKGRIRRIVVSRSKRFSRDIHDLAQSFHSPTKRHSIPTTLPHVKSFFSKSKPTKRMTIHSAFNITEPYTGSSGSLPSHNSWRASSYGDRDINRYSLPALPRKVNVESQGSEIKWQSRLNSVGSFEDGLDLCVGKLKLIVTNPDED